jgi:hypothetical protein
MITKAPATQTGERGRVISGFGFKPMPTLLTAFSLLIFSAQLAQLTYFISHAADSRPVIAAIDNDASNAIDVAQRSRWYNDNGFQSYGPVYFRLAHTFSALLTPISEPGNLTPAEAETKAVHFALLLVSLVSLYGLSLLLAALVAGTTWGAFTLSTLFMWAFLHSPVWQRFLLRAHPDTLLSFLVAVAALLTFRLWRAPANVWLFRLSAWAWGLALATKFSTALFLPWVMIWFVLPPTRNGFVKAARFAGHLAVAYLVIGFPQNFGALRTLRFLIYQSSYSKPATWASVTDWFAIWGNQILAPLVLSVALAIALFGWSRTVSSSSGSRMVWLQTLSLAFGPFALMATQEVIVNHDHYMMPLVATQIVLLISFAEILLPRSPRLSGLRAGLGLIVATTLIFVLVGAVPRSLGSMLSQQLACRGEAREVFKRITEAQQQGLEIYGDPYAPVLNRSGVSSSWTTNVAYVAEGEFDLMILNAPYYNRYYHDEGAEYASRYNPDLQSSREFYDLFKGKTSSSSPALGTWERLAQYECGWEIWRKVKE